VLTVTKLSASYGGIAALEDVTINISAGEMVALIGANGAGKSTLLNCLSGIVPATGGSILFKGSELTGRRPAAIAKSGLLQVPEGRQILGDLSVEENLLLGKLALGRRSVAWVYEQVIDFFPVLGARKKQLAGLLSGGEQQMLAIGRALMGAPDMLLLDEPSLGLAPRIVDQVFAVLSHLNASGMTILLVEQNARRSLSVSSRAYVLANGRVVRSAVSKELLNDPEIIAYYLGSLAETIGADTPPE
jgi:branched-chain amino acid transport system ATP-binding protein